MMDNSNKKIAFVSGGSKGIGLAIVLKMIDKNYQVITCGRNIKDWNESKEKNPRLDEVDFIKTDLCNKRQLERLFSKIKKKYGRLDAAVNNAAVQILAKGQFTDIPEDILHKNLDSDLWMPTMCIKKELELMMNTGGSIVNITSISGVIPTPDAAMYSAAKYGLEGLTKTLALELIDKNIRLNTVAPGPIMTPRWEKRVNEQDREEVFASVRDRSPSKRLGTPEEVASGVLWLLSDEASYVVGHTLIIDGGMSLRGNV
jgi:NAD(P)-dependent dehydrogenase (short-subunit alcohol dehydrogenase family)